MIDGSQMRDRDCSPRQSHIGALYRQNAPDSKPAVLWGRCLKLSESIPLDCRGPWNIAVLLIVAIVRSWGWSFFWGAEVSHSRSSPIRAPIWKLNKIAMKPAFPKALLSALALSVSPAASVLLDLDAVKQKNYLAGFRDQVTSHVVPMVAHPVSNDGLRRRQSGMSRLTNIRDFYYIIEVEVGKQKIPLHLDTGSSDTWMVRDPFECVSVPGMGARMVSAPWQCDAAIPSLTNLATGSELRIYQGI